SALSSFPASRVSAAAASLFACPAAPTPAPVPAPQVGGATGGATGTAACAEMKNHEKGPKLVMGSGAAPASVLPCGRLHDLANTGVTTDLMRTTGISCTR